MSNEYFVNSGIPSTRAPGVSSTVRAEYSLIEAGFDKLPVLAGNGSKVICVNTGATALEAVTTTGTGSAVRATSPTLVTPTLGVASATSINKVALTQPAASATLTIADGKTLTASNTLTLTATDGSTLAIGTGGTLGTAAYVAIADYAPLVSPSFTTPALGVATATSINKVALTAPATASTLTIADGKTLTASNTLTLTAVDGSTLAIGAGGTLGTAAYVAIADYAPLVSPAFTTPDIGLATGTALLVTGGLTSQGTDGIGYAVGAGGTVAQGAGSGKATGVTINKICGAIHTDGALLAAGAEVTFTVTNSLIAAEDVPVVCVSSGGTAGKYLVYVSRTDVAGSFDITISSVHTGSLSEQIWINFAIIKSVVS